MKKFLLSALCFLLCAFSVSAFAQVLPDNVTGGQIMSNEVTFNSADELMSGEIQIDLPFDPLEEETDSGFNAAYDYDLTTATNVETGPASIALFLMALALGSLIYAYRIRQEEQEEGNR